MNKFLIVLLLTFIISSCMQKTGKFIFKSEKYTVFPDSVVQYPFKAIALSDTELVSDYQSSEYENINSLVKFKFSINSRDNEMQTMRDHMVNLRPVSGKFESPLIRFGELYTDENKENIVIEESFTWHVKLDLRHVFKAFDDKGFFEFYNGQKLYRNDFKGVYIAGGTRPLMWDFENLHGRADLELKDNDGDRIYELALEMNPQQNQQGKNLWKLSADITKFPSYTSEQQLVDALYQMSVEEMQLNIRPDSTFMAGKEWDGVWTRDISYSIILSLAILNPEVSKKSLLRKVKNKRIIQDTGTGGSWPVSTDRAIWASAAWEVYKVTGDREWLELIYEIIRNSVQDDLEVAFDVETGLICGESSFLDWREQSYPKWMEPIDIYLSKNLGTNAAHYMTFKVLSDIEKILHRNNNESALYAKKIKDGINQYFWLEDKDYYAQYLYGRSSLIVSPRFEALGAALCILNDIADKEKQIRIVKSAPVCEYGVPTIFPQIPGIHPYHNNSTWPFVQAYWTLAAAKAGHHEAVTRGIGSIYRQAALFLTNKENFVAETGDHKGTAINSDRQLWSVAGNLALVFKLYFGMDFREDGIHFQPFVPASLPGDKRLGNFRYRKMLLDIELRGTGNSIRSFELDGQRIETNFIPANLEGKHQLIITLSDKFPPKQDENFKSVDFSPATVEYLIQDNQLEITNYDASLSYSVYRDGKHFMDMNSSTLKLEPVDEFHEYMLIARDTKGYESFAGIPLALYPSLNQYIFEAEDFASISAYSYKGYSGKGYVELSKQKNTILDFTLQVDKTGDYLLDFRYANGSGPVNTDNKCAIRTLWVNGKKAGAVVFPQRGLNEWSNWGYSNPKKISLEKGPNQLKLSFESWNENMNGDINTAMIDFFRLIRI